MFEIVGCTEIINILFNLAFHENFYDWEWFATFFLVVGDSSEVKFKLNLGLSEIFRICRNVEYFIIIVVQLL